MPPYSVGQCGAIQPRADSARYQGMMAGGCCRAVTPRSAVGQIGVEPAAHL